MKFYEALNLFYRRCLAKGLSDNTISYYRYSLVPFGVFMGNQGLEDMEEVREDTIIQYLATLNKKYNPVTVADRYIAVKAFFGYLSRAGHILVSPVAKISKPKTPKVYARTFTNKEVQLILSAFNKDEFIGYRNYVIMCILFSTGMRRAELLGLTVFDIHLDVDIISVIGKGNKQREIPISPLLKRVLRRYLGLRESYCKETSYSSPALIVTKSGSKMSISGFNQIFRKLKEDLKIPKGRLSPHTWRHTFSKAFLLNGGNLFALQKLLGHEDISTTRVYVDYTSGEMKTQNDKFNPLDNSRWQYY